MDVTPQLLTEVEFRQSLRGYDPDEVDRFLEQVAAAVAKLQGRLSEALHRADAAERSSGSRASAAGGAEVSTETITRTLVLAQRTADETVAEANAEAVEIRRAARAEIEGLEEELSGRRAAMHEVLEAEAHKMAEQTTSRLADEINQLELRRDELHAAIAGLQPQLDVHRNRLAATTAALRELVDDAGAFVLDLDLAESASASLLVDHGAAAKMADRGIAATGATESALIETGPVEDTAFEKAAFEEQSTDPEHAVSPEHAERTVDDATTAEADRSGESTAEPHAAVDDAEDEDSSSAVDDAGVFDYDVAAEDDVIDLSTAELSDEQPGTGASVFESSAGDGPPTQAVAPIDAPIDEDVPEPSAYVDDLRKAVGGGADSEAMSEFFADEGDGTVRRFGRTR